MSLDNKIYCKAVGTYSLKYVVPYYYVDDILYVTLKFERVLRVVKVSMAWMLWVYYLSTLRYPNPVLGAFDYFFYKFCKLYICRESNCDTNFNDLTANFTNLSGFLKLNFLTVFHC